MVGALNRAQAEAAVELLLSGLPSGGTCEALPAVPEVPALTAASQQRVPMATAQAHVLIGQPGIRRVDPAFFPITVGNYILGGGGFVSRLTEQVREKRGLSYSVYSYFSPGLHAGAFTVGLQTRPDQVTQAVDVASEVLKRFVQEGPTERELQAAKDNLICAATRQQSQAVGSTRQHRLEPLALELPRHLDRRDPACHRV
jgi:zinc protease